MSRHARSSTIAALATLAVLCAPSLGAEPAGAAPVCRIDGVVSDNAGQPVSGAVVTLIGSEATQATDAEGAFRFEASADDRAELVVVADGYAVAGDRVRCEPGAVVSLEMELAPAFGEELVVTGTRTAKRLVEVPVHTQIVPRSEIEMTASRTLADAVEYTSGLRVESNCQNCNFSQIRMLGLEGPYSQLLIDGIASVSSLAMVYGIEQLPARLIDSIEVVKGGGSATYGAGSVGGVINLITHQPSRTEAEAEVSYISVGGEPGFSANAVGDWLSANGTRSITGFGQIDRIEPGDVDGDGFSEVTQRKLLSIGGRFDQYALASKGRLSIEGTYTDAERRGGDLIRFDRPPHETALTEQIRTERVGLGVSWIHQVSSSFDYRLATSWASSNRDSYYGADFDPNAYGTTDNPLFIVDAASNRYFAASTLTFGAEYRRDEIDDVQLGYNRIIEESHQSLGGFVQDDRKIGGKVNLLYGARLDSHSALEDPILSPRLALMWSPTPRLTIRSSVASGFRPPATFDEDLHITLVGGGDAQVVTSDPDLVEESSLGYLLSTEWRPTFAGKGSAVVALNLFRTDLDDLFNNVEADDPSTPEIEFLKINQGDARVQGVEISGSLRWGPKVSADFGFVQQTSRFGAPEPDFGSRDFFRAPDRYGSLGVIWQAAQRTDLFAGVIYTDSMKVPHYAGFIEEDRLETTGSFVTLDVNLARRFPVGDGLTLQASVGIKNLTDEYQPDLDQGPLRDSAYVYGPRFPRSLVVGLKIGR